MAVFRVERNSGYTVMSNHHLRNKELTLKAKGLLSQMLSLPEDWDYTLAGLSHINRESIDAIRTAVWELEKAGYILRQQGRDEKGKMTAIEYTIYETKWVSERSVWMLRSDALLRYSFFYSGDNDYRNSVVSFCNTALLLISAFFSTPLAKQKEA